MSGSLDFEAIKARLDAARRERAAVPRVGVRLYDEDWMPVHAPGIEALMAHAPTDIEALVAEVERLRAQMEQSVISQNLIVKEQIRQATDRRVEMVADAEDRSVRGRTL